MSEKNADELSEPNEENNAYSKAMNQIRKALVKQACFLF